MLTGTLNSYLVPWRLRLSSYCESTLSKQEASKFSRVCKAGRQKHWKAESSNPNISYFRDIRCRLEHMICNQDTRNPNWSEHGLTCQCINSVCYRGSRIDLQHQSGFDLWNLPCTGSSISLCQPWKLFLQRSRNHSMNLLPELWCRNHIMHVNILFHKPLRLQNLYDIMPSWFCVL